MFSNQKGITPIFIILVLVILISVLGTAAYVITAKQKISKQTTEDKTEETKTKTIKTPLPIAKRNVNESSSSSSQKSPTPKPSKTPVPSKTPKPSTSPSASPSKTPTPTPSPTADPQISKWPTYYNTAHSFTLKYPTNASFEGNESSDYIIIDKQLAMNVTLDRYLLDCHEPLPGYSKPSNCPVYNKVDDIKVDGVDGKRIYGVLGGNISFQAIVVPKNGYYYQFQIDELSGNGTEKEFDADPGKIPDPRVKLMENIVSTFKFTN